LIVPETWDIDKWDAQRNTPSGAKHFSLFHRFLKDEQPSVAETIQKELKHLHIELMKEKFRFQQIFYHQSERAKMKRLLYLFQKDLIPGISGEILDSKDQRDHLLLSPVSAWKKGLAWCFLGSANLAMLFYVFLFAFSQDSHHQSAWGKSFVIWLLLEIILVSSAMVVFMHICLPLLLMKDVTKIKRKLMESIAKYYETVEQNKIRQEAKEGGRFTFDSTMSPTLPFNAAKYLFLSYRLASLFPNLKASEVILHFSTPWPRQSYQHLTDVKKNYGNSKWKGLTRSATIVLTFFLTSLISFPVAIQDIVVQLVATVVMGYTVLLHLQLYAVFPILVAIPTGFLFFIGHFLYHALKNQDVLEKAKLKKKLTKKDSRKSINETSNFKDNGFVTRKQSIAEGVILAKQLQGIMTRNTEEKNDVSDTDEDVDHFDDDQHDSDSDLDIISEGVSVNSSDFEIDSDENLGKLHEPPLHEESVSPLRDHRRYATQLEVAVEREENEESSFEFSDDEEDEAGENTTSDLMTLQRELQQLRRRFAVTNNIDVSHFPLQNAGGLEDATSSLLPSQQAQFSFDNDVETGISEFPRDNLSSPIQLIVVNEDQIDNENDMNNPQL
jgi:hypothetical protein